MEKYYRAKRIKYQETYTQEQLQALRRSIATHMFNIAQYAKNKGAKAKVGYNKHVHYKSFHDGSVKAGQGFVKAMQWVRKGPLKNSPIPDYYDLLMGWWINSIIKGGKAIYTDLYEGHVYRKAKRSYMKLKTKGDAPVIMSIGLNALRNNKGTTDKMHGALSTIINSNLKKNGILILNSGSTYYSCQSALRNFKGKVCISSNNGTFVTVMDGNGNQRVLKDKKLPSTLTNSLYEYFSNNNHNELSGYVMLLEGKDRMLGAVDLGNGDIRALDGKNYSSNSVDIKDALENSYNIRIVPKLSKATKKALVDQKLGVGQYYSKYAEIYNKYAGNTAATLATLPVDLQNLINEHANIQFGHDGSISIVPEGCSKQNAAELIADAYGLNHSQILTLASSMSDVCEPVKLSNIFEYVSNGGNIAELPLNVTTVNKSVYENVNNLSVINNFVHSADIINLKNKLQHDAKADDNKINAALARYGAKLKAAAESKYAELDKILKEVETSNRSDAEKDELIKRISAEKQYLDNAIKTELDEKKKEFSYDYDILRYIDPYASGVSARVNRLSNNANFRNQTANNTSTPPKAPQHILSK